MYKFKAGQKVIAVEETEDSPLIGSVVVIKSYYNHPEQEEPSYYIEGYERDSTGAKQVFPHSNFDTYLEVVHNAMKDD